MCRTLNEVATPIVYRTVCLNKRMVSAEAEMLYPDALHNISRHTNHLIVTSDLEPYGTKRILDASRNLQTIK